jgi:hypothetical protein
MWALGDGIDCPNPDRNGIDRILTEMLKELMVQSFDFCDAKLSD